MKRETLHLIRTHIRGVLGLCRAQRHENLLQPTGRLSHGTPPPPPGVGINGKVRRWRKTCSLLLKTEDVLPGGDLYGGRLLPPGPWALRSGLGAFVTLF